jgi:DNA-binding transcriptional MocR family regulator
MATNKLTGRIGQVMAHVRTQIGNRTLVAGARLPSVRAQAKHLQVSVSTVAEAYERLVAEGVILAKAGSGYYVLGSVAPLALKQTGTAQERAIDPLWISRQALEAEEQLLRPGCGWLPPNWLFEDGMRRALRAVARSDAASLSEYATPLGLPSLRALLARRLNSTGLEVTPEQIMLTESGTHAIDLICRFFLQTGDTVLVDDPCYFNFHALLKAQRVKVVGVPYTEHGPDLQAFQAALAEHKPRLYITNSGIHNPTGATLSPVAAHRLLKLIEGSDTVVVEDDIFAEFELTPAARLSVFDGLERVIQIGSFSKTLSASVRVGYVAAKPEWLEGLVDLKIATSFSGGRMAQELVWHALTDSGYRKHLDAMRVRLAQAMQTVLPKLRALGIEPLVLPQAGMFLWCRLPAGFDAAQVAQACLQQGVVLAPGNAFSLSQQAADCVRFNVAQCWDDKIFTVLAEVLGASA